ncbi:MAG: cellulase family glycosylhydrolase, partial [Bacillota bacterium]
MRFKYVKTITIFALLTMMILASSNIGFVHASGASALTVDGRYIKDTSGNTIVLRGVDYTGFIDTPLGSWTLSNGLTKWNTLGAIGIANNLDALKNMGFNCINVYTTTQFWVDNTDNFRGNIAYFISQAQQRGLYVELTYWRNNANQPQVIMPYADPYNGYINSPTDFVNLWASTANGLKDYPNVIFQLWNEPVGDGSAATEATWLNTAQRCINAIRETGATNLIGVQWGYGLGWSAAGWRSNLDWVEQYPLNDPLGNIVYNEHLYRNNFINEYQNRAKLYTMNDMEQALADDGAFSFDKPLLISEMAADSSQASKDGGLEYVWFENTLSLLNQNGIGYMAFNWAPFDSSYSENALTVHGQPNYGLTESGRILQQQASINVIESSGQSQTFTESQTSSSGDSTFGNTHIGSYSDWGSATVKRAVSYTLSDNNVAANSIVWYGSVDRQANMKCAIYTDNNGAPGTLKAYTQTVNVGTTNSWVTFPFSSAVHIPAGKYWLSFIADSAATNGLSFQYDSGSNSQRARTNIGPYGFSSEFNSPFKTVFAYDSEAVSIYVTYTTNGASSYSSSSDSTFGNTHIGSYSDWGSATVKRAVSYTLSD